MTLFLLAVSSSVFSWSMPGLGSFSAAGMLPPSLAKSVFLPSPRRAHLARVAVVALVSTRLASIYSRKCRNRQGHLKVPVILSRAYEKGRKMYIVPGPGRMKKRLLSFSVIKPKIDGRIILQLESWQVRSVLRLRSSQMRNCPNGIFNENLPKFSAAFDKFPFVVIFPHVTVQCCVTNTLYTPTHVETTMQQSLCIAYQGRTEIRWRPGQETSLAPYFRTEVLSEANVLY